MCEDATYRWPEGMVEINPSITATTTTAPLHHMTHSGTGHQVAPAEMSMDVNMTSTFQAGTYSAFFTLASNLTFPLEQSPSQGAETHFPFH